MKQIPDYKIITIAAGILVALIILAVGIFGADEPVASPKAMETGSSFLDKLTLLNRENAEMLISILVR